MQTIDEFISQALERIDGGLTLDVATGQGGFIEILNKNLRSLQWILGIDVHLPAIKSAQDSNQYSNVSFTSMDARNLAFPSQTFDLANSSASFHHLPDVDGVLREMYRVLKPGGFLVIAEMHRDVKTEAQRSSMMMHHWAASIDNALGFTHNPTYSRQHLLDFAERLEALSIETYDWSDHQSDPYDKEAIQLRLNVINRYLDRAKDLPNYAEIESQAEELKERFKGAGVQREPIVIQVGRKS
jgi:ubiquinone/menaquinone biosynthesis C-methylase UbiE